MKKYQLPKEFATKWVEALRSGEYKQGIGTLFDEDKNCYCGAGVYAQVNGFSFLDNGNHAVDNKGQGIYAIYDRFFDVIWRLNDREGLTFNQQADWIESNVEFI